MDIEKVVGKVFRSANGEVFGQIRRLEGTSPSEIALHSCNAFAEDECGNYFVESDSFVGFWDHETNEITKLAGSVKEFLDRLVFPKDVSLHPGQVVSAWIDHEFLRNLESK
jgi:hypothetical protein